MSTVHRRALEDLRFTEASESHIFVEEIKKSFISKKEIQEAFNHRITSAYTLSLEGLQKVFYP